MSRYLVVLHSRTDREKAHKLIDAAPPGARVEVKTTRRSLDQNSKMWVMLSEIATQVRWHGMKLRPEEFKVIFLDALKRELRAVPSLDGTGFVNIGRSSSDLTKAEMGDLIELMQAFGAEHGVKFADELEYA
jgi:hypothetical protein